MILRPIGVAARYSMEPAAFVRSKPDKTMNKIVVLIIEDEALISMSAAQMIQDAGFETAEAANADEAIAILEGRGDVAAVFTDVSMPGSMDGLKLARAIRERWPPIHVVVTSGLTWPAENGLPANGYFIQKPYVAEQVVAALRKAFGPPCKIVPIPIPKIQPHAVWK